MTTPSAWLAWLLPLTILLPAVVLATRSLRRVFRDPADRPALLVSAAVLGVALPLAHPAMWFLADENPLAATDLAGIAVLVVFVALLVLGCGIQALRGGRTLWVAGALLGLSFFLADRLMVRIVALEPAGLVQLSVLALVAMGLGALAFHAVSAGRSWLAGGALLGSMVAGAAASLRPQDPGLAGSADPLPALALAFGLGVSVLIAILARRTAERRVRALRGGMMSWLSQMAEATPEATAVLCDGRIAAANPALLALLGQPETLVMDRALADLFPREGQAWWEGARQGRLANWSRARLLTGAGLTTVEVAIRPLRGAAVHCLALICRDLTQQIEAEARLQYLTRHDALTGLRNRVDLHEALERQIGRARHAGTAFAVLQLGMDDFKALNDVHGQGAGDLVLREVAERITALVGPDTPAARTGGDEFTLVVPVGDGPQRPDRVAERLLSQLREPHVLGGEHLQVTGSIGVAIFPRDADHADELLAVADLAMQRAKAGGGGRVALVDAERDAEARADRLLEQDLRLAVQNRQLRIWLQPQARASDLMPVGFEALIRWQHPVHGLISPARFIPIAETSGLMHEIGTWALREVMRQAASWPQPLRVAVNVSPLQLPQGDLVDLVRAALTATGLLPERLEVEITESALIEQGDGVLRQLEELQGMGVRVSLDDFGTGYSSLAMLRAFPFDKLKMDRAFLEDIEHSADAQAVVRAVLALGRALRMTVVAEGVQTVPQLDFLREEGCDLLQGHLLGAAALADRFPTIIEHGRFGPELAARLAGAPDMPDVEMEAAWELAPEPLPEEAPEPPLPLIVEPGPAMVEEPPALELPATEPAPVAEEAVAPEPAPAARQSRRARAPAKPAAAKAAKSAAPAKEAAGGRAAAAKPKRKEPAIALQVSTARLNASGSAPAQRQEGKQQERREGNAAARPAVGRARQEVQPAPAPRAQQGGGQKGGHQRPAEVLKVDGRHHRAQLHVAPAHQPKPPGPPKGQKADAGLKGQKGQGRLAPERPAQQQKRGAGQDGRVGNAAAAKVAKGGQPAPGRQRQQPEKHSARAPSSAPAARIGRKAAAPQPSGRWPTGKRG